MKMFRVLLALPMEEKAWVVLLFLASLLAKSALLVLPLRYFFPLLGSHHRNDRITVAVAPETISRARRMGSLMQQISGKAIWETRCLPQAISVKWLLNRYRIPAVFYLGARIDADSGERMKAHAWVQVDDTVIVGGPQHIDYQVVATFAPEGQPA